MKKIKFERFKLYFRVLSIFLVSVILIGYFPKNEVIADTTPVTQTDADYLGKALFYDYYGSNKIGTQGNNDTESKNGRHYYFEKFNQAVSEYSSENNIMYPLYFGDFNSSAGDSNEPEKRPESGQALMGNAYKFFWAANRASRSENENTSILNSKYTASVQGLVSDTLKDGKLTQDIKTIDYAKTSSKLFNINSVSCNSGTSYENLNSALDRNNVLKINYPGGSKESSKDYRVQLNTNDRNFSGNNKYLSFDVYNETNSSGGSLFIALKDGSNRQIAGWSKFYGTEYYDNTMKKNQWQTIVIDLEELKGNDNNTEHGTYQPSNFNFNDVASIFVGYWGNGGVFIDKSSIKLLGDIVEKNNGTVELPYFNSSFLSSYGVGDTTQQYEFPFKKRSKTVKDMTGSENVATDYYIFSSGKSGYQINNSTLTDVVRINKTTNHLDYWFDVNDNDNSTIVKDMNGKEADFGGTGENEPGFFPFNEPRQSGKLDNPDSYTENGLNYGFGARIEIQFKLTEDGTITVEKDNKTYKVPIEFNFKGDDDVWVYIDGELALDMGGGHSQTEGNINFAEDIATVKNVVDGKITSNSLKQPVKTKTKKISYKEDGKYDTNKIHTLTLFYMERGMIESNLYMDFNFIPSDNELIVEKEVDTSGVNEILASATSEIANKIDFGFNISENNNLKENLDYKLNVNGAVSDKTMNSNIFQLKHTNFATFYNKFTEGSEVIVNERQDNRFTTTWITKNLSDKNNEIKLGEGEGTKTKAFTIPKNTSLYEKYIYYAKFTNKIKTGNLNISKNIEVLEGDNLEDYKDDLFNFKVTFKSILGTEIDPIINYYGDYYVSGEGINEVEKRQAKNIDGNWVIQLKAGQTAEIRDIPVGTTYEIEEILGDKYEIHSITGENVNGNKVSGTITVEDSKAEITYTNRKKLRDIKLIKVDSSDSNIKLKGAEFTLNKLKEDGSNDESFEQRVVTSDENGQAYFKDLPYGKYVIMEVKAPDGYQLLKEPIEFEVSEDSKAMITIEIKNIKDIVLPITGSNGTIGSNYIGVSLIALALTLYLFTIIKKKRYKLN